jgi:hypothetical protein
LPGFTFSEVVFLLRVKVEMERVGREAEEVGGTLAACEGFSGEKERARVAEGVFLCEDVDVFVELLVRRDAERERRNVAPMSATDDEMLCRDECLMRRGGVSGNFGGMADWSTGEGGLKLDEGCLVEVVFGGAGWVEGVGEGLVVAGWLWARC